MTANSPGQVDEKNMACIECMDNLILSFLFVCQSVKLVEFVHHATQSFQT